MSAEVFRKAPGDRLLSAVERHGRLELPVRKLRQFLNRSGDAGVSRSGPPPLAGGEEQEGAIPSDGLPLGEGPTGPVTLKNGRFGVYVEMPNGDDKPKRAQGGDSHPKSTIASPD